MPKHTFTKLGQLILVGQKKQRTNKAYNSILYNISSMHDCTKRQIKNFSLNRHITRNCHCLKNIYIFLNVFYFFLKFYVINIDRHKVVISRECLFIYFDFTV